jgi:hypothetical protein
MVESLQNVLEKIILPQYPTISHLEVSVLGLGAIYKVLYYTDGPITIPDAYKIMHETTSLFKMLGPTREEDLIVNFEKIKKDELFNS